jgi:hypothetical protein
VIPQENHLERAEPDWVSARTKTEKSSKGTFLGCKEGRQHGVGEGVVTWVNFWFSFFCVNMITCGKVSNAAYFCIFFWQLTYVFNTALYVWLPIILKGAKVQ